MYEITDFKELIEKAKIQRNIPLLEEIHITLLEYLTHLQEQHRRNIRHRNYSLKTEIEQFEDLNLHIFGIYATLDSKLTHKEKIKIKKK